jgi:transposase InsO family protein
VWGLDLVGP